MYMTVYTGNLMLGVVSLISPSLASSPGLLSPPPRRPGNEATPGFSMLHATLKRSGDTGDEARVLLRRH